MLRWWQNKGKEPSEKSDAVQILGEGMVYQNGKIASLTVKQTVAKNLFSSSAYYQQVANQLNAHSQQSLYNQGLANSLYNGSGYLGKSLSQYQYKTGLSNGTAQMAKYQPQQYLHGWTAPYPTQISSIATATSSTSTLSISLSDEVSAPVLDPVMVLVNEEGTDFGEKRYRVPVYFNDEKYHIWVGHRTIRLFDKSALPDFIKVKLALIEGHPESLIRAGHDQKYLSDSELFLNSMPPEYNDVGWRASKHYYILTMTVEELESLRLDSIRDA